MRGVGGCLLGALLLVVGEAWAANPIPLEYFARLPDLSEPKLSPNGKHLLAEVDILGKQGMVVLNLSDHSDLRLIEMGEDTFQLGWVEWANDDQVLIGLEVLEKRYGVELYETRLVLYNVRSETFKGLNPGRGKSRYLPQIQDQVIHMLPQDPVRILLQLSRETPKKDGVYRVSLESEYYQREFPDKSGISAWLADETGMVRARTRVHMDKLIIEAREAEDDDFDELIRFALYEDPGFTPVGFVPGRPEQLLVFSPRGTGRSGLWTYNIREKKFGDPWFIHDTYDVTSLVRPYVGGEVLGVRYIDDMPRTVYFHELYAENQERLEKLFPRRRVTIHDVSLDRKTFVVSLNDRNGPPNYYLYRPASGEIKILSRTYANLQKQLLAPVERRDVAIDSDLSIPTYLTFPPNGVRENLPTVIMPHGGPASRDFITFDFQAQFLASRGYLVVQPNFRGSSGYGAAWREAGRGKWGGLMREDVEGVTRVLMNDGIADPERTCIYGGSFGGYMAMLSAVRDAGLFKCAASLNGVSDLDNLYGRMARFVGKRASRKSILGDTEKSEFFAHSPVDAAKKASMPVLLLHGEEDRTVLVRHSEKMHRALKRAKKDVRYVELENDDHYLHLYESRKILLKELEKFLKKHIGQGAVTPVVAN